MGSPSVSTHRGLVHWQGLLLVVSLLTFWSPPTTAEISVVSTYAAKGSDVLLRIRNKPPEAIGIVWYKGRRVDKNNIIAFSMMSSIFHVSGPGNFGEEMITDDGSLLLKNITMKDAGIYTVVVHLPHAETEIGSGLLQLHECLGVPVLLASRYEVRENENGVVLTCYTNILSVLWLFNDMNLLVTNRMRLTKDRKELTINPVRREDAGVYKCKAWNTTNWVESRPLKLVLRHL